MAAPSTVDELLDRLRRSGLVPPDRLEGFLIGLSASGRVPTGVAALLDRLVEAGMITRFHAERLAAGKYKGFVLGSYLILDLLGSGGMGQVYLAEHTSMRRLVAVKVLPVVAADSADDRVARERFLREARVSATLDHPNIVRVFDLCQEGRLMYLVMEYVEGISFQAMVARLGALPVAAAAHYARQVAFGLQHAHEMGCVHRDVKPANLLVDRSGVVKILDLGLVRTEAEADAGLTRKLDNKGILGTADYVAPEQAVDSSNVDARADIYALGATLYFLLSGRPLFPEGRTAQKLVWQQIRDPAPLGRLRPDVPPALAALVHAMIQKKPADRPQTAALVFDALEPWTREPVALPEESLLPVPAARALASRGGVAAQRPANSTSQLLTAAMRSASGMGSSQTGSSSGESGSSAGGDTTLPGRPGRPGRPIGPSPFPDRIVPDTGALAVEDTQRRPSAIDESVLDVEEDRPTPGGRREPPAAAAVGPGWRSVAAVGGLLVAAGMAVAGLVLLIAR